MPRQFDFLESFIHNIMDEAGFAEVSEATRSQFVPLFVAEAERRLGLALLPLLNEAQAKQLGEIMDNENSSVESIPQFWQSSVPNFEDVVEDTLDEFAEEFKKTLASVKV